MVNQPYTYRTLLVHNLTSHYTSRTVLVQFLTAPVHNVTLHPVPNTTLPQDPLQGSATVRKIMDKEKAAEIEAFINSSQVTLSRKIQQKSEEIETLRAAGIKLADVVKYLDGQGVKVSENYLNVWLHRAAKRKKGKLVTKPVAREVTTQAKPGMQDGMDPTILPPPRQKKFTYDPLRHLKD